MLEVIRLLGALCLVEGFSMSLIHNVLTAGIF